MTNKELQEKIARIEAELTEVKEMVVEMKKPDGGVFKPEDGQYFCSIMRGGDVVEEWWNDNLFDHDHYAIGNCFPNKQAAEDAVRVLKLIQKARESRDRFAPDWEDSTQNKYSLHFDGSRIRTIGYKSLNTASIFGCWGNQSVCDQFIQDNHDELLWFFTEYRR